MKHRLATIAAATALVLAGTTLASTASANSVSVSVGVPGFAVGYSNHGGYAYVGPPVAYAPPVAYYGAPYYSGYE